MTGVAGCGRRSGEFGPAGTWVRTVGQMGYVGGRFVRPRALAVAPDGTLAVCDMTARLQLFGPDGAFLRQWSTPDHRLGRPSGLSFDAQGRLWVADSHYHQLLCYHADGTLLSQLGGHPPTDGAARPLAGVFGYLADVAVLSNGHLVVAEGRPVDRLHVVTPAGRIVAQWGGRGEGPGQFQRLRGLAVDPEDNVVAADACNHRLQVFRPDGTFVKGLAAGRLLYPYDVSRGPDGSLYVVEYGGCRVRRLSPEGDDRGAWGAPGRRAGQLNNPWAVAVDAAGLVTVADSDNHRLHQVRFA